MEGFGWGLITGVTTCLLLTMAIIVNRPSTLDVYRGKTTLEITYRDSIVVDSVVVYKVR